MGTQFPNAWVADNKKLPFEHACAYMPETWEPQSGSAVRMPILPERTFSGRGTGSRWSEALAELAQHVIPVSIGDAWLVLVVGTNAEIEKQLLPPPTVSEKLIAIRDAFGLSAAALALILRASRASVYNWLENETPTDNFVQRIDQLSAITSEWQNMNLFHFSPGRLMKQKLGEGAAMLERLSREELDPVEIQTGMRDLVALMTKHRERLDKSKARVTKAPADVEDHREILERLTGSITADR